MAANPRKTRVRKRAAAVSVMLTAGGCVATTSDEIELRNVDWWKVIPKSSPSQLVNAFDRYCFAADGSTAHARLIDDDYVQVPKRGEINNYVVDSKKPLVMLSGSGSAYGCAVAAEARTGQRNKMITYIEGRSDKSVPVSTTSNGDTFWQLDANSIAFVKRSGPIGQPPQILIGVSRSETKSAQTPATH